MVKHNLQIFVLAVALTLAIAVPANSKPQFKITKERVKGLSPEMQLEIGALQYFLNPYQLNQFFSLPGDSLRREWIEEYWRALDPTPTTDKNEMMIEHYVRVRLAREFFSSDQWPGWDKRGEVFIRYGAPNYRTRIHSEVTARKVHPPGRVVVLQEARHDRPVRGFQPERQLHLRHQAPRRAAGHEHRTDGVSDLRHGRRPPGADPAVSSQFSEAGRNTGRSEGLDPGRRDDQRHTTENQCESTHGGECTKDSTESWTPTWRR